LLCQSRLLLDRDPPLSTAHLQSKTHQQSCREGFLILV
jgi:hypothetical protein